MTRKDSAKNDKLITPSRFISNVYKLKRFLSLYLGMSDRICTFAVYKSRYIKDKNIIEHLTNKIYGLRNW